MGYKKKISTLYKEKNPKLRDSEKWKMKRKSDK